MVNDRASAAAFAAEWVALWNRAYVEGVLAHYAEELEFASPRAASVVGRPVVRGKPALRAYWRQAMAQIGSLRFHLDRALWDADARAVSVLYEAAIDARRVRACEIMWFGPDGRVVRGEAFHGAPLA